ncbi:copper resistance protein CopC, partial [Alicyclobacillus sp.]|uniref:copper resistance CopC family protein n=1 Tax=Alicyclobacillus sp. TaxID=61169 RepID=UPI0025C248EF
MTGLRRNGWWWGILLVASVWIWLCPMPAFAHAYVVRSDPIAGASLTAPPARIQIWFDEPVDAGKDALVVTDERGRRVDAGDARVDPKDPLHLSVSLQPNLGEGLYSAHWRVVSADGHPVAGTLPFSVG